MHVFSFTNILSQEHKERIILWSIPSLSMLFLGFALDLSGNTKSLLVKHWVVITTNNLWYMIDLANNNCLNEYSGLHMNKSLYSLSYTCVTTGTASLFFTAIYSLVGVFLAQQELTKVHSFWKDISCMNGGGNILFFIWQQYTEIIKKYMSSLFS